MFGRTKKLEQHTAVLDAVCVAHRFMLPYAALGRMPTDAEIEREIERTFAGPGYPISIGTVFAAECFKISKAFEALRNHRGSSA